MPYMTVIAPDLGKCSMEYEPKRSLSADSDSTCVGEIQMFQSLELLVSNVLSVISVNMD